MIPDIDEYNNLLDTIKDIVNKNWNNEKLNKRLSYNTDPIIKERKFQSLTRFPEFFKIGENGNYKVYPLKQKATITHDDKTMEILLLRDKRRQSNKEYLQNSGNSELKRFLNNLATDFNVVNLSTDFKLRISFIAIWLNIYETVFEEIYKLTNSELNENNLNIMFKGGVTMRAIILTAYIDLNLIDEINTFDNIKKIIKISDFDFEIISSTNDWKLINKLNIINYFVMNQVLEYFENNKETFFTLFKYNKNVKTKLGKKLFDKIDNEIKLKKEEYDKRNIISKYADYYALIEPLFIEIETNNDISKNVFSHPIEYINNFCNGDIRNLNTIFSLPNNEDKTDNFRKNFGIIVDGSKSDPIKSVDLDNINLNDNSEGYLTGIISEEQIKNLYNINF